MSTVRTSTHPAGTQPRPEAPGSRANAETQYSGKHTHLNDPLLQLPIYEHRRPGLHAAGANRGHFTLAAKPAVAALPDAPEMEHTRRPPAPEVLSDLTPPPPPPARRTHLLLSPRALGEGRIALLRRTGRPGSAREFLARFFFGIAQQGLNS